MNNRKYIIITILVLIVAVIIFFFVKNKQIKSISIAPLKNTQVVEVKNEQQNLTSDRALDAALDKIRAADKDLDGLSDEEEKKLGTNWENPDSDADGLLDGDEIKFYKSDPLKSDTDNDGFKDGNEVRGGYSPIGSGKLKK